MDLLLYLLLSFVAVVAVAIDCPLDATYEPYFRKCYKFFNTPQTFLAAEQTCNSIGGHLVDIQNAFENTYVVEIPSGSPARTQSFWIGANLLLTMSWSWTANTSMFYTNWAPGQPISSIPCAFMRGHDGLWATEACNVALPFVCASDPNAPQTGCCITKTPPALPTSTVPPPSCPSGTTCASGFTLFSGNCLCYKYFNISKSFKDSNSTCAKNGGFLASSTSSELNTFLISLPGIDCLGAQCPYIGLFCDSSLDKCQWADGSAVGNYTKFFYEWYQHTIPPPYPTSFALAASPDNSIEGGYWEPVDDNRSFICQKPSARMLTAPVSIMETAEEIKKMEKKETLTR